MEACGLLYDRFHGGASQNIPQEIYAAGAMEVLFDMNKMYLFDVETETVIKQELPRPQEAS